MTYDHKKIEQKWQKYWEENKTFKIKNDFSKPKYYTLDMFPYPSGAGLHVGHLKGYTANDIIARYKNACGYNVLHPMGYDAFGLPAENYAIKTGTHPKITTDKNIENFRKQIKSLGFSYDWSREIDTTDPNYYKWTQWIFLKMFEHNLAYEQDLPINYCPYCKTSVANEEVLNDFTHERCGTKVEKKKIKQWVLAITKYADRLASDVDKLDWPEGIKDMQKNWIGKSEGIQFKMFDEKKEKFIEVYTTRIDTVFGMTYAVLAPDHPQVLDFITPEQKKICLDYIDNSKKKSDQDRTADNKEKTGVFTGSYVINPYNNEKVPLWIADYVLGNYGTGAVMAVPAHDERDFEFAKKYDLGIKISILAKKAEYTVIENSLLKEYVDQLKKFGEVIVEEVFKDGGKFKIKVDLKNENKFIDFLSKNLIIKTKEQGGNGYADSLFTTKKVIFNSKIFSINNLKDSDLVTNYGISVGIQEGELDFREMFKAFTEDGILVNSGDFDGLSSEEARQKLTEYAEQNGFGTKKVNYKLRDWLYSRQRYWGEPIPLIHLEEKDVEKLINLNFYEESIIDSIIDGTKTIETRALNPEEEDRYFGNVKVGDMVTFTDKAKDIKYLVKIKEVKTWKNIEELYKDKQYLEKIFPERNEISLEELKKLYSFPTDYIQRIEKNGLIGFSFKVFSKIYNGLYTKIVCDYNLPVKLPEVDNYEPAGDGQSPLAKIDSFVNIKLADNLTGKRETNTMPQWGGSCWYYLRYMDPKNDNELVNKEIEKYYGQVDSYVGGAEHAVLHLLYARFWHKFLYDIGVVNYDEPFKRLRNQGLILTYAYKRKNGGLIPNDMVEERGGKYFEKLTNQEVEKIISKMSKSLKNVVNPDDVVEKYGVDSLRLYEMYMADFKDPAPWDTKGIMGVRRFLEKAEKLFDENPKISEKDDEYTMRLLHKTIKKVQEDIENYKFNTAIAALMILINNGLPKDEKLQQEFKSIFTRLLHPFAPHLSEELWERLGNKESVFFANWPKYDEKLIEDSFLTIAIQVNGKLRSDIQIYKDEVKEKVIEQAKQKVLKYIDGKQIIKEIYVFGKIVNIVVK